MVFEGAVYNTSENKKFLNALSQGCDINYGVYIEGESTAYVNGSLLLCFGNNVGVIPDSEMALFDNAKTGVCLVGKIVGFYVVSKEENDGITTYNLSRKAQQKMYHSGVIAKLKATDIIDAKVLSVQDKYAFVDIGYGVHSVIQNVDASVVYLPSLKSFFEVGENVKVIVKRAVTEDNMRLYVSHKELLGTWEQNIALLEESGGIMNPRKGVVAAVHSFGVFIMLAQNLVALTTDEGVALSNLSVNEKVSVVVKNVNDSLGRIKVYLLHSTGRLSDHIEKKYFLDYDYAANDYIWHYYGNVEKETFFTDFKNVTIPVGGVKSKIE